MDLVLAGLAIIAGIALFAGFILGVMRFEEWRQRRGYARVGEALGASPKILGRHAAWRLWGIEGALDGCEIEVRTVVGASATGPSFSGSGQVTNRPLMTKIRVRPPRAQTLPPGALVPASDFRGRDATSLQPNGRAHAGTHADGRLWSYGEVRLDEPTASQISDALEGCRSGLFIEADRVEVWLELPTSGRRAKRVSGALSAAVLAAKALATGG